MKKLRYGNTNTFFINGLLVDTDWAGTLPQFYKEMKACGINFKDIKYVMATHYHPDHIGLISELMDLGVTLIIIDEQKNFIHFSDEIFRKDKRINYKPIDETKAVYISIDESMEFLNSLGIKGEVIHTPGHSDDSVSLILDEGVAIVGDLDPLDYMPAYDKDDLRHKSWQKILSHNPGIIYYSHANEKYMNK